MTKKYSHSFILIHGFMMDGETMKYYQDKIKTIFPHYTINFIKPTATKIGISIYDNERYHSWYDYYTPSCDEEPYINENQLVKNRLRIHKLISKEIHYHNGNSERVFLLGMSQGCCMSLDAGLTFPMKLGGIIGFKGHVIKKTFEDVYKDIRKNVDLSHHDGSIKNKIIRNLDKYINKDKVKLVGEGLQTDPLGFAFPEGSPLVDVVNQGLAEMKSSGKLQEINDKCFSPGFTVSYDDIADVTYDE